LCQKDARRDGARVRGGQYKIIGNKMDYRDIAYETKDNIATITLNRPEKMNRLSVDNMKQLCSALDRARDDSEVRVVIITGAGDKAFCAGADLNDFRGLGALEARKKFEAFADISRKFIVLEKPSIASVNGLALAGGFGLAIYPDITIASEKAMFGLPEINVGLWSCIVSVALPRIIGRKKALELLMTGRLISAVQAESMGLINCVVPHNKLARATEELARELSVKSPLILRLGRRSFYGMLDMEYEKGINYILDALAVIISTEDCQEGVAAFVEKRKPIWKSR